MTDNLLTLFCLVNGESNPFPLEIDSTKTIGGLKNLIVNGNQALAFRDDAAKDLILWRVSIPVVPKERKEISLADIPSKEELDETDDVSDVFEETPPKKTIHIIVQRPPLGDLRADIKKIADRFFATGSPASDFLDAYVRGEKSLPVTTVDQETLGLFLYRYCLLDATEIVLENEVQLVEAAFGRIKIFGGTARTVLDEPFVLKATLNYFREKDPSLVSAAERAMLHSDNASVYGGMRETMMPHVFLETFKSRPLSSWPLLANYSLLDQLIGDVTIVGYDEQQPNLAASHRNLTTQQFMKAHVENNSKKGGQDIPPFYFPAPHISGPDVVFYIKIGGNIFPVFVQLNYDKF
ncbi:hypothetical protein EC957_011851 [Mortierella hygrophila]|uniref:Crinkler effector protein N-terminal domain-containing protein n=1 Tax=Mortierella hygrophila TaxID=979708 RepID=A0A9P6JX22_9FUNG|nr:hypothetical protein EC957_011851 [Mortierella hygrophila]